MAEKTEFALMRKNAEEVTVAPADVAAKLLDGWNVVGFAEMDADGKPTGVTGRVIETPAHVIETADHVLRTIPKFDEKPAVIPPAAAVEEKSMFYERPVAVIDQKPKK